MDTEVSELVIKCNVFMGESSWMTSDFEDMYLKCDLSQLLEKLFIVVCHQS